MFRLFIAFLFALGLTGAALAQSTEAEVTIEERAQTGGATTLEDILARQRGEKVDNSYRSQNTGQGNAEGLLGQLGTRGVASDSDVYRAIRYGSANTTVSSRGPAAGVLIQDGGMWWLNFRTGPLREYGTYILGGWSPSSFCSS